MNVTKFLFFNVSENVLSKRDFTITRREIFDIVKTHMLSKSFDEILTLSAEATQLLNFSKKVDEESDSETNCSHSSDSD